jgi:hypothetical protein
VRGGQEQARADDAQGRASANAGSDRGAADRGDRPRGTQAVQPFLADVTTAEKRHHKDKQRRNEQRIRVDPADEDGGQDANEQRRGEGHELEVAHAQHDVRRYPGLSNRGAATEGEEKDWRAWEASRGEPARGFERASGAPHARRLRAFETAARA